MKSHLNLEMSNHWISAFHYSNWLPYLYCEKEEIVNDVVCEEQSMEFMAGYSQSMVSENSIKHSYEYNMHNRLVPTTTFVTETKPHYTPNFEWRKSYVVIINKKYTVHIGLDTEQSKEYVKTHFPIGTKFTVTTYLSEISVLSTDSTSAYLWPKIQPKS